MIFFFIKPDAVRRNLIKEIYSRLELGGFTILLAKKIRPTRAKMAEHYKEYKNKEWFEDLLDKYCQGEIIIGYVYADANTEFDKLTELIGPYNERIPGTIRGDLALNNRENSIHSAKTLEESEEQSRIWFNEN